MILEQNALRIPFIPTTKGLYSPVQALQEAHEVQLAMNDYPAFQIAAVLRFLTECTAVVLQEKDAVSAQDGLKERAIEAAVERMGSAVYLKDAEQPFMQQPAVASQGPKDTARYIAPGEMPVKKLLPNMPPDTAEDFWNLSSMMPEMLPIEQALLCLLSFHYYSPAGNNKYNGSKCQMGTPGLRFLGADNSATEFVRMGSCLLTTLLMQLPKKWVDEGGLPAWADRRGDVSYRKEKDGSLIPTALWRATWSSNAAVCLFDEQLNLVGVRVGGVPEFWLPKHLVGSENNALKEWWDQRNEEDPFYLYTEGMIGNRVEKKCRRLDIGRDHTDLLAEWIQNKYQKEMDSKLASSIYDYVPWKDNADTTLLVLRHRLEGTASSPAIRASETLYLRKSLWMPDNERMDDVATFASLLRWVHSMLLDSLSGGKSGKEGLSTLKNRRQEASDMFWRLVQPIFEDYLVGHEVYINEVAQGIQNAVLDAFDFVAQSAGPQHSLQVAYIRNRLTARSWSAITSKLAGY